MEYQKHGFDFEDLIISNITGVSASEYKTLQKNGHISVFDIDSGTLSKKNYSIKVSRKSLNVWTSDILRFYDCTKNTKFNMIVGCWYYDKQDKRFDSIIEFFFSPRYHGLLWNDMPREELESFCEYIKNIPHGWEAQQENKFLWKEKRDLLYKKYGRGLVSINAKIDSGVQRRVQSGIKVKDLFEHNVQCRVYDKSFHGLSLPFIQK